MAFPTTFAAVVTNPGGTGSTITPVLSSHDVDDVIEIFVAKTGNVSWTAPAGWTIKQQLTTSGGPTASATGTLLYRKVLSSDTLPLANPVCDLGASVTRSAVAITKRGADVEGVHTAPVWLAFGGATGNSNPIQPPAITTVTPDALVHHYYCQRAATDAPEPTSYTQTEEAVISGTLVLNVSERNVAAQDTLLSNQDASPTSGARWVGMIAGTPSIIPVFTPDTATLTITSFAPSITLAESVTPATNTLALSTFAPSIELTITPSVSELTLTSFAPSLSIGVIPTPSSLSLITFGPSLSETVNLATLALALTSFAPSILVTDHVTVIPTTQILSLTTFAPITEPPQIIFLDPGGDAVQAIGHFNTVEANGAGISFDTTQKVIGIGSYKFDSGANLATYVSALNVLENSRRVSVRFRFDSTHTAQRRIMQAQGAAASVFYIALSAGSVLQVIDGSNATVASGSTPLDVDIFYRIGIAFAGAPDNMDLKVFLDGIEELFIHLDDTGSVAPLHLRYGWIIGPGTSKLCWFDQIYVDDGSDLSDPGNRLITAKLPATTNANDFDTTGGTGAVNERPLSETNYKEHAGISQVSQNYTLQTAGAGDVDISSATLFGYMGWVWASKSEANGSHALTLNGTDHPITLITSPARYDFSVTSSVYPSNVAGIGLVSGGSAADTFLYECGAVIAFAPAEAGGITVVPSAVSLTVVTLAPSLRLDVVIGSHSLALTRFAAALETKLTPSQSSLTLASFAPSVVSTTNVIPATVSLTVTQFAPSLNTDLVPGIETLVLASFAPQVVLETVVKPDPVSLVTDTFAANLISSVQPETVSLTAATFAPTLRASLTPSTGSLVVTTFAPSVIAEADVTAVPDATLLTLTTFNPIVNVGNSVTVEPPVASLTIETFAASLIFEVVPVTQSLVLETFVPSITVLTTVQPAPAALATTGFAPSLQLGLTPAAQLLSLQTFAPQLDQSVSVIPSSANLTLTSFMATLSTRTTPSTQTLSVSTFAPTITIQSGLTPEPLSLTTTGFAPSLQLTVTPSTSGLAITSFVPVVSMGLVVVPATETLTVSSFAPSLSTSIVLQSTSLNLSAFAPTIVGGEGTADPDPASLVITTFAPTESHYTTGIRVQIKPDNRTIIVPIDNRTIRI